MVTKTLSAMEIREVAYEIKGLIALSQWIEQARRVVDTIDFVSAHTERGAEARGLFNLSTPDWDDLQSDGLDLLLSKIYSAAGELEEDADKAKADGDELSPEAFDALSLAGQCHYLADRGLRSLPAGDKTDESRRCLTQLHDMFAGDLADERDRVTDEVAHG